MAAVPVADPEVEARRPRAVISGEVPSALRPPPGCSFHTRCPRAMPMCKIDQPLLRNIGPERAVACHPGIELTKGLAYSAIIAVEPDRSAIGNDVR